MTLLPPSITRFIGLHKNVYIYPIVDLVGIRAFFFRSVEGKDFRVVSDGKPYFYGLFRFKDFKYGDLIILSEGIKDAEAIALFYPYALACMGNCVSRDQAQLLKRMSDKVAFLADSDYGGKSQEKFLLKRGVNKVFYLQDSKDPGEWWEGGAKSLPKVIEVIKEIYDLKD